MISMVFFVSRSPVGSSSSSSWGLLLRALAIATRCCSPPDSSEGRCAMRSCSPTSSSSSIVEAVVSTQSTGALSNSPQLLLLDEPTGDLDTKNTIEIMDLLLKLNVELATTCVMVTHNPDVECYADRVIYINDGRIVKQAVNLQQTPLVMADYMAYLNSLEHPHH
eukprot:TRINITY_DN1384_c0_g1_i18.p2 TRINITY_DN1384_c0_g1~~TRINITY_DN1384_c0_g1_i18.p2  ORF type:complete len:165 (-),score=54.52 TRINITY_DN1384_c0_g1_i18:130-624(-)